MVVPCYSEEVPYYHNPVLSKGGAETWLYVTRYLRLNNLCLLNMVKVL